MMRSFGRAFSERGGAFILISGQAAVLYGASTISENIDLWVRPTARDLGALKEALRALGARAHKLPPPLEIGDLRRGHGFHFRIPSDGAGEIYVDVMGRPPRVGSFGSALRRAVQLPTPWGRWPVCAIEDLVLLKRTRRPPDYDVISNLARIRLKSALATSTTGRAIGRIVAWALDNAFRLDVLLDILELAPGAQALARRSGRASVRALAKAWRPGLETLPLAAEDRFEHSLALETLALRRADAEHWRPVIDELRELRRAGRLLEEGSLI